MSAPAQMDIRRVTARKPKRRPGSEVRRAAEAEGLKSLRESALHKVFSGVSTLHEINRVTFVEELSAI